MRDKIAALIGWLKVPANRDKIIGLFIFTINLLGLPTLFYLVGIGFTPWWCAIIALALWRWLMLPGNNWQAYAAGMTVDRVKHGCEVVLPADDERCLEPDHECLIAWQLGFPAMVKNWIFNHTWGALYFKELGSWRDRGFTDRMNRYRYGGARGWRVERAFSVCARWLDRFDRRGVHR